MLSDEVFAVESNLKKVTDIYIFFFRQSHRRCSLKDVVLKNFAIFSEKHQCWTLFLIKLQSFKRLLHRYFPVNIAKLFQNTYFKENLPTAASISSNRTKIITEYITLLEFKDWNFSKQFRIGQHMLFPAKEF